MADKHNSASRLYHILSPLEAGTPQNSTHSGWTAAFQIPIDRTKNDPNLEWMIVVEKIHLARKEMDSIEPKMRYSSLSSSPEVYQKPLAVLRNAFDATVASNPFQQATQYINDYTLHGLNMCAALLPDDGSHVTDDELLQARQTLSELREQVEHTELTEEVRDFFLAHIQILEQALVNYRIQGSAAFVNACTSVLLTTAYNHDNITWDPEDEPTNDILDKLITNWEWVKRRIDDAEAAKKAIALLLALAKAGQLVATSEVVHQLTSGNINLP
jgi:hypothetical protein